MAGPTLAPVKAPHFQRRKAVDEADYKGGRELKSCLSEFHHIL